MPANAIDLCLASDVAADLGIAEDATVQRVVTAASRAIATYCGRTFERETGIIEYPASYGRPFLLLERAPILAITSIEEFDAVVDASEYESTGRNADAGLVFRKSGCWRRTARDVGDITPAWGVFQGETGSSGIKVTYDAGWVTPGQVALDDQLAVTLPEDVQEAAILAAVAFYRRRGVDPNVASESLGDWSVSYRSAAAGLPDAAAQLLGPYVLVRAG